MSETGNGASLKPILVEFFARFGFTEEDILNLWAKPSARSLRMADGVSPRIDNAVCRDFRELSQDEADDHRIQLPAVVFYLKNSREQWIISTERVVINGKARRELRFTTAQFQRDQSVVSPMWTEDRDDNPGLTHRGSPYLLL